jgi:DNA-binding MarR family transcriptional regulator
MSADTTATGPPGPTALAGYTGYLLRRAYVRAADCAKESLPAPNRLRDILILSMLEERAPISQQRLAELTGVNRTIVVKLIDDLENRGLVVRTRNPADRRSYALEATAAGRKALAGLQPAVDQGEARLTAGLSAGERTRLNELLNSLLADAGTYLVESLIDRTGYLVNRAHYWLRTRAIDVLAPLSVEPRHFGALIILAEQQPCSQQQLATALGISAPVALELIDELEAGGLVQRARNAADRRAYDLTLTKDGKTRLANARDAVTVIQQELAVKLGAKADGELRGLLTKLLGY